MLYLLLFAVLLIIWQDIPGMIKKKDWKTLALAGFFISAGLILSLLLELGLRLPSLANLLVTFVERFFPFIPAFFRP